MFLRRKKGITFFYFHQLLFSQFLIFQHVKLALYVAHCPCSSFKKINRYAFPHFNESNITGRLLRLSKQNIMKCRTFL